MKKPITPAQAAQKKLGKIPDEVIEVVNDLLAVAFSSGRATLKQDAVVDAIVKALVKDADPPITEQMLRRKVYDEHWLDFEPFYRAAGWKVEYHKPAYYAGDNFDPYWEFVAKRGGRVDGGEAF